MFQRRRGLRKVGGGWRGQKYYDPPSANSASNPAGAVQEGNLRLPAFHPSKGALHDTNMRWKSEGKGDSCTGSEDDNGSVASSNEVGAKLTAAGQRGSRGGGRRGGSSRQ